MHTTDLGRQPAEHAHALRGDPALQPIPRVVQPIFVAMLSACATRRCAGVKVGDGIRVQVGLPSSKLGWKQPV